MGSARAGQSLAIGELLEQYVVGSGFRKWDFTQRRKLWNPIACRVRSHSKQWFVWASARICADHDPALMGAGAAKITRALAEGDQHAMRSGQGWELTFGI